MVGRLEDKKDICFGELSLILKRDEKWDDFKTLKYCNWLKILLKKFMRYLVQRISRMILDSSIRSEEQLLACPVILPRVRKAVILKQA